MGGKTITKRELARMKALNDLGEAPWSIAQKMGRSHHTVSKWLQSDVYENPDLQQMVAIIKEKELDDLYLLGAKARKRLHSLIDGGDTKMIETCAVMDRTFQQRRLLEGQSTQNISTRSLVEQIAADRRQIMAEIAELKAELAEG